MTTYPMLSVIDLVNSEARRLGDFLASLTESNWFHDSACDGWKVGDVVAHLTVGSETWANSLTRAAAGDAGPPSGQNFLAPGERGSESTAQAAVSVFQDKGLALLEDYRAGYDRLAQVLAKLRAEDWDKPCFHRRGPMPVQNFVALRVQELAVHGWDIRSGLDPAAEMGEEPLPYLVNMVPRWLRTAFLPGQGLPEPARFRFDVASPVAVNQDVVISNGAFEIEAGGEGAADAVFRCNTGNYILLVYGRLGVEEGLSSGRFAVEGSAEQAANFTRWFQGF